MLALLVFGGVHIYQNWHTPPLLLSAEVASFDTQSGDVTVRLSGQSLQYFGKALWLCLANENLPPAAESELWLAADEAGSAELTLPAGVYYAFAKDARGNVSALPQSSVGDAVLHISVDAPETVYLPYGGSWQYQPQLLVMGETDTAVSWRSSDESIATVENGVVTAQNTSGTVTVTAKTQNGLKTEMQLLVTDLFKLPNTNTYSKPMLRADVFTDEEAALLDDILAQKVALAGYGTRAGAVAAARFLALEFPYRVPYFFENGRMSPHPGRPVCDGEGRYYHEGLYLSENKYDELEVVRFGPATWGELLINWEEKYHFKRGEYYPNGLDCSGFVSWCMINGGNDFGDMGAGYSTDRTGNNMCELGELLPITKELMLSDRVKVGDLIGTDGHIAIIIGITDDYVYIAESLITSVRVMRKPRSRVKASGLYDFVVLMDGVYAAEGNYTEYWE
ncbi:MAG: Ig-like domain-containing protein [Oscillospiraceae bacterium]|nr:Ig-like domain-containing protein [Oscillospiraceae bacterium]